jgi:hypothetical protein
LGKQGTVHLGFTHLFAFRTGADYGLFLLAAQTKAKNAGVIARPEDLEASGAGFDHRGGLEFYKQSLLNSLYSQYEPLQLARTRRFTFRYPPLPGTISRRHRKSHTGRHPAGGGGMNRR